MTRAWVDIDNPPQVQYLSPLVEAFRARGAEVLVTARDYGITTDLLQARGIEPRVVGRRFRASKVGKALGTAGRALRLAGLAGGRHRPALLVSTSRSASMAAWLLRIPAFTVLDYEHAELRSFRTFGVTILHPQVIPAEAFVRRGFPAERLVAFRGIKEDISFAGRDLDGTPAHDFGLEDGRTIVLVRPPSETSHYFQAASRDLTHGVLQRLAAASDLQVVFSPREPQQAVRLREHVWANEPIVLQEAVDFVSLLKAVDWVVCAGGTMLREAAYLGVPAISLLRDQAGAVDLWLAAQGSLRFLEHPEDVADVDWRHVPRPGALPRNPQLVQDLAKLLLGPEKRG